MAAEWLSRAHQLAAEVPLDRLPIVAAIVLEVWAATKGGNVPLAGFIDEFAAAINCDDVREALLKLLEGYTRPDWASLGDRG